MSIKIYEQEIKDGLEEAIASNSTIAYCSEILNFTDTISISDLGGDEAKAKAERNSLLADSDIYMIEDFPTTKKTEWKAYRKELRDMDFSDLDNLKWPTKPE